MTLKWFTGTIPHTIATFPFTLPVLKMAGDTSWVLPICRPNALCSWISWIQYTSWVWPPQPLHILHPLITLSFHTQLYPFTARSWVNYWTASKFIRSPLSFWCQEAGPVYFRQWNEHKGTGIRKTWVWIPALLLISYMTIERLFNFSELLFSHQWIRNNVIYFTMLSWALSRMLYIKICTLKCHVMIPF